MTFKRYDVITFEENDKVVVLAALVHEGNEYVFVNEILPDESDVTHVYKIMVVHYEDGTLARLWRWKLDWKRRLEVLNMSCRCMSSATRGVAVAVSARMGMSGK